VAIVQSAKKLRKSDDSFIQTNVFINANLTKAEANAQFEIRQHRRQTIKAQRHVTSKQGNTPASELNDIQSLLNTANNLNAVMPLQSSTQPLLSVSGDSALSNNNTAPSPAAEQSQQQGKQDRC
jgi:hypothetical protein